MPIVIVHQYSTELSVEIERILARTPTAADSVIFLSVMSEGEYRGLQSTYRSLRDVHIVYSIDHAEDATTRDATKISSQLAEALGLEITPLGRVGNPLRIAAAVAKAHDAESVYFTDTPSWLRRWYRRRRLSRLGFRGAVYQLRSDAMLEPSPEAV